MLLKAFLLVVYVGGHSGYLSQGDLLDEAACHQLFRDLVEADAVYRYNRHYCLPYTKAPGTIATPAPAPAPAPPREQGVWREQ